MSAYDPGCVKTLAVFLCDAPMSLNDPARRVFWVWRFMRQVRVYGPELTDLGDDQAIYGFKSERRGAYAAIIAAISGRMPMMLMTRLRL